MTEGGVDRDERGHVVAVRGGDGAPWIEAVWDGDVLLGAEVTAPSGARVGLGPAHGWDPVLGRVHPVIDADAGRRIAWCSAIDLAAPRAIPALDRPGAVPAGAGTALLNLVALQARAPLGYAGPYPTGSLFDALCECFRPAGDPRQAWGAFQSVEGASSVAFQPAPFSRHLRGAGVVAQLRGGRLERAFVDGRAFGLGARQLVAAGTGWRAVVALGGQCVEEVATLTADGGLVSRPERQAPPDGVVPPRLGDALRGAVRARTPSVTRTALAPWIDAPLRFGDAGWDAVCWADGWVLHGAWPEVLRAEPRALDDLLRAWEDAVVRRAAQQAVPVAGASG